MFIFIPRSEFSLSSTIHARQPTYFLDSGHHVAPKIKINISSESTRRDLQFYTTFSPKILTFLGTVHDRGPPLSSRRLRHHH
ncbi:hypothetical protein F511_10752 [Dorcoceras hygrometricum]|uniref:Uncharacterized protein n=1 Tax=Dorcoceras hygrometricum TaxID=472368 RepID=A0A2Z7CAL1_9LAMI|nr:hypothetical protein F511_10752 [Dorcoceras hygrometricum]